MKRGLILLMFLGIFLMLLSLGSAMICQESDLNGYLNYHAHCPNNACTNCNTVTDSFQCESFDRGNTCNSYIPGRLWKKTRSSGRCRRSFVCPDSHWVQEYNCSGNNRTQKYNTISCGTTFNSCITSSSWKFVATCEFGCANGICRGCSPSLTIEDYLGLCGTNFSNGCTDSLVVNCPIGSNCNVSSGQGVCIPEYTNYTNNSYWANLRNGSEIASAQLGDSVVMVFRGQNLEGQNITYFLQNYSSGNWFQRLLGIKNWRDFVSIGSSSSVKVYPNLNLSTTYRFNVLVEGTTIGDTSSNLTVSSVIDNSVPFVEITSIPKESQTSFFRTSVNFPILFNHSSYDEDDLLNITWDFGDGNKIFFENYSSFLTPTLRSYSYSQGGRFFDVVLTAKEMLPRVNPQTRNSSVRIYVFQPGVNVVPIINSPEENVLQSYLVWHNASQSYVVNCSISSPIGSDGGFSVGNLNCTYLLVPGKKDLVPGATGKIRIRWSEINEDGSIKEWIKGNATHGVEWNSTNYGSASNFDGAVVFPKLYLRPALRRIRMEMVYN